jgi:hypothetical protein
MSMSRILSAVVLLTALCSASLVRAQEVQQATAIQPIPQQFILGDWYEVSVRRESVTDKISGILLETNDEWIVLATITHNAYEKHTGTPILMYLPYVGGSFRWKKTQVDNYKNYRWVPRDGVQVDRHSKEVAPDIAAQFPDRKVVLGESLAVSFLRNGKPETFGTNPTGKSCEEAIRELMTIVPKRDVLYVQSVVPLTAKEIKKATAK